MDIVEENIEDGVASFSTAGPLHRQAALMSRMRAETRSRTRSPIQSSLRGPRSPCGVQSSFHHTVVSVVFMFEARECGIKPVTNIDGLPLHDHFLPSDPFSECFVKFQAWA